ncbi:amidase signature enzyme [Dendrothele bispora CBS 962.96]|uniref:Amidase signature enzyme n=1 Tax=Dendrothele bispora (strain CBS 962.96) TaxID=1314807 RepID=A0A4S8M3E5_DENBC|nr:amidase signature enzyme [Dendrothele bispora CBS 962.96]
MSWWIFSNNQVPGHIKEQQLAREKKLHAASLSFSSALTLSEEKVHALSISELVRRCGSGEISPSEILSPYAKKTLQAQDRTNCVSDIMFDEALSSLPTWPSGTNLDSESELGRHKPLLGVPISLKDTVDVEGHDTTIGFSKNVGKPVKTSAPLVRLLQDAGAIIHAKTTVPTGLFSVSTASDVFGVTMNPYKQEYSAGASTGGGAALVACGGSKIEIGSDAGGSLRLPAHFCGIWSLKGSIGRFPVWKHQSSMNGCESIPLLSGPLAGSLEDLEEFWKRVMEMRPWEYDFTCVPLPWRPVNLQEEGRKLKWGIIWEDGVIPPTPACRRALSMVAEALKEQGHEVVDFTPPPIPNLLEVGYQLLFADGGEQIRNQLSPSESLNPALQSIIDLLKLPRWFKSLVSWFTRKTDPIYSNLVNIFHSKSIREERDLVMQRDTFKAEWHEQWMKQGLDFVLTVPAPIPAMRREHVLQASLMSCSYLFLFNVLDYAAGILPVTNVDRNIDALPTDFSSTEKYKKMNTICKNVYSCYNSDEMHGLPLGVQVIGRRMEEEKVIEGMKVVESALKRSGTVFEGLKA